MGNCLGCGCLGDESDVEQYYYQSGYGGGQGGANRPLPKEGVTITYGGDGGQGGANRPLPKEGVTTTYPVAGHTAVASDLLMFEYTNKVPSNLSSYFFGDKATKIITQRDCYGKLLRAWKEANPPPTSDEAVVVLIKQTLQGHHDIQGLLKFYHLPCPTEPTTRPATPTTRPAAPTTCVATSTTYPAVPTTRPAAPTTCPAVPTTRPAVPTIQHVPQVTESKENDEEKDGLAWPPGVTYAIHTLPVEEKTVKDGDGFIVYVDVNKDDRETAILPQEIKDAVEQRRIARSQMDYITADALQDQIKEGDYKVVNGKNGRAPCLLHKYEIRLRGVDAPERHQPYGEEAKVALMELVKDQELLIHVYNTDVHGREVGDVYCNGVFIQEVLLKMGTVWHYRKIDKRPALAKWETEAKDARLGLWMAANPEAPWTYKYRKRNLEKFKGETKRNKKSKRNQSFTKRGA